MRADDYLWDKLRPAIHRIVSNWLETLKLSEGRPVAKLVSEIIDALKCDRFDVFMRYPNLNGPKWSIQTLRKFRRDFP
jgi:hypothetical protein